MRKILTFFTLFLISALSAFADETTSVKLSDEHSEEQIRLAYCNLFVKMISSDEDGNAKISIQIENLDESNAIYIFGRAYPEKELKKQSPPILFDKNFPGTKGSRTIDTNKLVREVVVILPADKYELPVIQINNSEKQPCRLPLYFAKEKDTKFLGIKIGKPKMLLMEKQILELEIEVEPKRDVVFERLELECNNLINEINKQSFCNNSRHTPSLEEQETPYKDKIDALKSEIDKIIDQKKWFATDEGYKRYNSLKVKLSEIDFASLEKDCGKKHGQGSKPVPSCKYCNLTPQQIYHKLDDIYKKIYNSNDRKATKESVMADVNLLYGCRKHSVSWKNNKDYNSRIINLYNRIINF